MTLTSRHFPKVFNLQNVTALLRKRLCAGSSVPPPAASHEGLDSSVKSPASPRVSLPLRAGDGAECSCYMTSSQARSPSALEHGGRRTQPWVLQMPVLKAGVCCRSQNEAREPAVGDGEEPARRRPSTLPAVGILPGLFKFWKEPRRGKVEGHRRRPRCPDRGRSKARPPRQLAGRRPELSSKDCHPHPTTGGTPAFSYHQSYRHDRRR